MESVRKRRPSSPTDNSEEWYPRGYPAGASLQVPRRQMPEMDGLQATAAIRKRERSTGKHVPILAVTAHAMAGDHDRCLAAGMDGYVSKPIRTQELFEALEVSLPCDASW